MAIPDKLSVGASSSSDEGVKLVGLYLCVGQEWEKSCEIRNNGALVSVQTILKDLAKSFLEEMKDRKIHHRLMIAVDPDFQRLKIGTMLLRKCLKLAYQRQYEYSYGEATNPRSISILLKTKGSKINNRIIYNHWNGTEENCSFDVKGATECNLISIDLKQWIVS